MYRIYHYFAIASGVVVFCVMIATSFFYYRTSVDNLVETAENDNVVLARSLSNTVLTPFFPYIRSFKGSGNPALQPGENNAQIDKALRAATRNLPVLKIKLYTVNGLTIYSSEAAQVGEDRHQHDHQDVFDAAAEGRPQSQLSYRDRFSAFSGEIFGRDVVETYVPISAEGKGIIGVFELYTDVTQTKKIIDRAVVSMLIALFVICLVLYIVLVFVVARRAIAPLGIASEHAASLDPRELGRRLPTENMPQEIMPLIESMNGALERLDTALEAQRRFTADAAHELLTPLAVLTTNLDTLKDREESAALRQDVEAMSSIVTLLLEQSEVETALAREDPVADPRKVCAEVISAMAPLSYQEDKALALTGAETPPSVNCSPTALNRAVANLVKNAIAHTPPGTCVEIDVGDDGTIRVRDRGPGVPLAERELIFQRFWRGRQGQYAGAGLGLSIVKSVVDSHGGDIEVDDAPDGGAVFCLRLPVAANTEGAGGRIPSA